LREDARDLRYYFPLSLSLSPSLFPSPLQLQPPGPPSRFLLVPREYERRVTTIKSNCSESAPPRLVPSFLSIFLSRTSSSSRRTRGKRRDFPSHPFLARAINHLSFSLAPSSESTRANCDSARVPGQFFPLSVRFQLSLFCRKLRLFLPRSASILALFRSPAA